MDKVLGLGDVFSLDVQNFNWTFLIPITIVACAIGVFLYGIKKSESPKFYRSVAFNNSNSIKRKKRNVNTLARDTAASVHLNNTSSKDGIATGSQRLVIRSKPSTTTEEVTIKDNSEKSKHAAAIIDGKQQVVISTKKRATAITNGANKSCLVDAEDVGEWQTVTTRKQKKQTSDAEIQDVAVKSVNKTAGSPINRNVKTPTKSASSVKDNRPSGEELSISIGSFIQGKTKANRVATLNTVNSAVVENIWNASVTNSLSKDNVSTGNVAFNEIGDWIENSTQKRNKKRALKEH